MNGEINGTFIYNGKPMNGATAKLWKITAFASYVDSTATIQDDPLAATAVEVNTSDGTVFAAGDVIQAEDENMLVLEVATNKLYVIRGYQQTTPAEHIQGTTINDQTITEPAQDDSEPGSGQQGSSIETGVAYGGDGAYRWTSVPEGEYYVSLYYDNHRAFLYAIVPRDDPSIEQILTVDGDTLIHNAERPTRLPAGSEDEMFMMGANRPYWGTPANLLIFTELAGGENHAATGAGAWEDYDLSAIVPAGTVMVLMQILYKTADNIDCSAGCRKNGTALARLLGGVGRGHPTALLITNVDANRVIDIYAGVVAECDFSVLGYWS